MSYASLREVAADVSWGPPCFAAAFTPAGRSSAQVVSGNGGSVRQGGHSRPRDVSVAMRSIDDTLGDLLYDQARALQHEVEDLTPV